MCGWVARTETSRPNFSPDCSTHTPQPEAELLPLLRLLRVPNSRPNRPQRQPTVGGWSWRAPKPQLGNALKAPRRGLSRAAAEGGQRGPGRAAGCY